MCFTTLASREKTICAISTMGPSAEDSNDIDNGGNCRVIHENQTHGNDEEWEDLEWHSHPPPPYLLYQRSHSMVESSTTTRSLSPWIQREGTSGAPMMTHYHNLVDVHGGFGGLGEQQQLPNFLSSFFPPLLSSSSGQQQQQQGVEAIRSRPSRHSFNDRFTQRLSDGFRNSLFPNNNSNNNNRNNSSNNSTTMDYDESSKSINSNNNRRTKEVAEEVALMIKQQQQKREEEEDTTTPIYLSVLYGLINACIIL